MAIEIIDVSEVAHREKKRTVVINTRRFHAWIHYYENPGDSTDMHCHNEDQTFYVVEGELTMHFPERPPTKLTPGKAALIRGGSFYRLENTGSGALVLLGNRSGSQENIKHINFETGKDTKAEGEVVQVERAVAAAALPAA
jgi:mannose-6-phosphate isomerase-like protein (cupin superfamily)